MPRYVWVIVVGLGSALLAADFADAGARSRPVQGCGPLGRLESVFPAPNAAGFTARSRIKIQPARDPVWPGRCGAFWTTYTGPHGKNVDVAVTLYQASKNVGAPLAEGYWARFMSSRTVRACEQAVQTREASTAPPLPRLLPSRPFAGFSSVRYRSRHR